MFMRHKIGDSTSVVSLKSHDETGGRYNNEKNEEDGGRLIDVWDSYSSSTTLHCLSRAAKSDSSAVRRLSWVIFLGAMLGLLVWQSYIQISRYLEVETLLNEHSAIDEDKTFPALTICDVNLVKQSDVPDAQLRMLLTKTYMATKKDRPYFENLDTNWARSINIEGIFHNHSALDMFLLCLWQKKEVPCQSIFSTRTTSAGTCVTLKKMKLLETDGVGSGMGLTAILHSNVSDSLITSRAGSGFMVLVHAEQEEPDIDELGLALTLGTASLISVTKYKTSFLRYPVPALGDDFCIDTTSRDYVHSLKYKRKFSYGACRMECLTDYVQDSCGCKGVFMPGDGPICDVFQMVNCYDEAVKSFARNSSCECSYPCETTSYSIELSQGNFPIPGYLEASFPNLNVSHGYMKENGLMLEVFLNSKMYFRREQILQFTASDLVASIGGYMGLFIGASFGTLMELIEFFFDLMFKLIRKATAGYHRRM